MYHLELRKFPHTVCRFNQSEQQLRALVVPWTSEQWIEEGERRWNANEATITVLEGPKLSMHELAMGRGWRNAQRRSEDVTERVLEAARRERAPAADAQGEQAAAAGERRAAVAPGADSLALELLAQLDAGPVTLADAWQLAAERLGGARAADSLALAEQAVRSLLERQLVVLQAGDGASSQLEGDRCEAQLRAVDGWAGAGGRSPAIARKR